MQRFRRASRAAAGAGVKFVIPAIPHTLLLHFDGTNGDTTTTEVNGRTVTRAGNGTPDATISSTQSKFGGTSHKRNSIGGWNVGAKNSNENFGTGDFTLEAWIYMTTGSKLNLIVGTVDPGGGTNGIQWFINTDNKLRLLCYDNVSTLFVDVSTTTTCPLNQWVYAYAQRSGTTFSISLDCAGTNTATSSSSLGTGVNTSACIGHDQTNSFARDFNGYIDEVALTKGTARNITTVPTAAYTV